jgi:hypothetical protein
MTGITRVYRGSGYNGNLDCAQVSIRITAMYSPSYAHQAFGFRLACSSTQPE